MLEIVHLYCFQFSNWNQIIKIIFENIGLRKCNMYKLLKQQDFSLDLKLFSN